jgi:hypothetical protein
LVSETVAREWDNRTTSGEQRGGRRDAEWPASRHGWESNREKRTTLASRERTTSVRTMVVVVIIDAFPTALTLEVLSRRGMQMPAEYGIGQAPGTWSVERRRARKSINPALFSMDCDICSLPFHEA